MNSINGLNSQLKRSMCLEWLKMHSIDVALIQETHFKHIDKHKLANRYYHTAVAACYNSKSCGVLIVLKVMMLINDFCLIDLYRIMNPSLRKYSFYSNRHQTYSRIDYFRIPNKQNS
uniref:Endonuclease/exonuclease/phosphatase domain-containing protein n=1 Tax=Amphiprion ocellaris TaxID=80972 RepID=A0AAQ5XE29_AMPOC